METPSRLLLDLQYLEEEVILAFGASKGRLPS
jgi:hypothetical protein